VEAPRCGANPNPDTSSDASNKPPWGTGNRGSQTLGVSARVAGLKTRSHRLLAFPNGSDTPWANLGHAAIRIDDLGESARSHHNLVASVNFRCPIYVPKAALILPNRHVALDDLHCGCPCRRPSQPDGKKQCSEAQNFAHHTAPPSRAPIQRMTRQGSPNLSIPNVYQSCRPMQAGSLRGQAFLRGLWQDRHRGLTCKNRTFP
jgi:hypothetical protein